MPIRKISHFDLLDQTPSLEMVQQRPRRPISVLLDHVRSLYNVGSIFRTSDAVGVEKLYLCGLTGYPPRAEIHKAALGAEKTVPWEHCPDPVAAIHQLKSRGYRIVVLENTDQSQLYHQAHYEFPLCLVVGHEITGVSDEVVALADQAIEIPMAGIKQSLNVAVAYGVAIYEIIKHCPDPFQATH
ncbi:MAG: RNA methyltransferase [candidate division KSB1 bacterium]|nr:RNA methyltransferase [candidate division KSB1 bacterium]MDZ7357844.1 RNA methyltransferase [candidate division KSB1 bacterium]